MSQSVVTQAIGSGTCFRIGKWRADWFVSLGDREPGASRIGPDGIIIESSWNHAATPSVLDRSTASRQEGRGRTPPGADAREATNATHLRKALKRPGSGRPHGMRSDRMVRSALQPISRRQNGASNRMHENGGHRIPCWPAGCTNRVSSIVPLGKKSL